MTLTDEELDRDWKPNGRRPQSTIARSFSAELMDIFKIDNSLNDLDEQVDKRKQVITHHSHELTALEARIKEMEERLRRSQAAPGRPPIPTPNPPRQDRQQQQQQQQQPERAAPREQDDLPPAPVPKDIPIPEKSRSRPGAGRPRRAPSSGVMPPTPGASEGEYELIDKADLDDDEMATTSTGTGRR